MKVPCRECGGVVSTEASACPHCGLAYPSLYAWQKRQERKKSNTTMFALVWVLAGLIAVFAIAWKLDQPRREREELLRNLEGLRAVFQHLSGRSSEK